MEVDPWRSTEDVRTQVERLDERCLVLATLHAKPVGTGFISSLDGVAEITRVATLTEARRQGVACVPFGWHQSRAGRQQRSCTDSGWRAHLATGSVWHSGQSPLRFRNFISISSGDVIAHRDAIYGFPATSPCRPVSLSATYIFPWLSAASCCTCWKLPGPYLCWFHV
jgi:hypothetical protein